ncbi:MAG: UvrD-helicase domain-containing protein [Clostridia bacterium]
MGELNLNSEQQKAVENTEGVYLVFAGAGSGKTRVLTNRVTYLVEKKGIKPYNILAITFTNKATSEMKQRLNKSLQDNSVWVSTFHSLCTQILWRHADKLGYTNKFSIFDDSGQTKSIKQALREKHLDEKKKDIYVHHISRAKNQGLTPDQYYKKISTTVKDATSICAVYERYQDILKQNNAMDFDDLLFNCVKLFANNQDVLEYYQNKFQYIHVDEFQDTNKIQFDLVKMLGGKWGNIFVVGDDDQSIYGWRGADIENILSFDKSFDNVTTYKLEQNYRSTQPILTCANNLIKYNMSRAEKTLFTEKKQGVRVEYLYSYNDRQEVDRIISTISYLKKNSGYVNKDFAILVRQNSLTRLYEMSFNKLGIDYKVFGGFRFFDRAEVQNLVAYLKVISNPLDTDAISRIINFPARGIGATTIEKLVNYSDENGQSMFEVIANISNNSNFSEKIKNKVGDFANLINQLSFKAQNMPLVNFVEELVKAIELESYYKSKDKEEDINRWENVLEFLKYIQETFNDSNISIEEFLHSMTLNRERAETQITGNDFVSIATMHAVKGLEFKVVFIVACEEGILPSYFAQKEPNGIEEERRVMYVAITRAQERLYISCVKGFRRKFNKEPEATMPSRFVGESMGDKNKFEQVPQKPIFPTKYTDDYSNAIPADSQIRANSFVANKVVDNKPKVLNSNTSGYVTGAKVTHKKYGTGTIIITTGSGIGKTVTVAFKNLGVKKFAVASAPLELE